MLQKRSEMVKEIRKKMDANRKLYDKGEIEGLEFVRNALKLSRDLSLIYDKC